MDIRIGTGIDFHRLISDEKRPLLLGGFEIPGELALEGHSDADILLHAAADAVLGAVAYGDIGDLFPDTDPQWKNMDSRIIMKKALDTAFEKGYKIMNIDSTLIGERPKVSPYRQKIRESMSQILDLSLDRVSLKATTVEKMGAIGRKEGIAVISTVLLSSFR